ncbi:MAG: FeoB-associated Cys-rich membrane protein [Clostridia bacterium]|nr:FeoB-associated Cys-rich membrane protein [Clostridia bacterium]MBR6741788.1 FeoB-associated Cys-rich membrane protein [Clostridia bacterium]
MKNAIIIIVLALIVAAICLYLYKAKKRGEKCIGCPYAKQCSGSCSNCDNNKSN